MHRKMMRKKFARKFRLPLRERGPARIGPVGHVCPDLPYDNNPGPTKRAPFEGDDDNGDE